MPTRRACWCLTLGILVAALAVSTATAGEDAESGETFISASIEGLADADPRHRRAAQVALTALGARVVPALLGALGEESTGAEFERIATVWRGMPAKEARQALLAHKDRWSASWKARLEAEVARLHARTPPAVGEVEGAKAKWLRATIRELIDPLKGSRSFGTPNPTVDTLVALGPTAVPFLLESLKDNCGKDDFYAGRAVAEALAGLITPSEVPAIEALLEDDCIVAAYALRRLRSEEVAQVLLDRLEDQRLDGGMLPLISEYTHRDDFRVALAHWLRGNGIKGDFDHAAGSVARLLGEKRVYGALPLLRELAAKDTHGRVHWQFVLALVLLGEKAQIEKLVYYFRYPASDWDRYHMGHALNWVVGKIIYVGSFPGGTPKDPDGNEREIKEFQSWWDANKTRLTYDRIQGYTVGR